jgi:hypothetical protein
MAYIGKTPSQAVRSRYFYTASGGETSFSGADDNGNSLVYTDGNYVDVYLNGVLLVAGSDYNTNTTNTVAGVTAVAASDIVEVVVYDTFSVFGGDVLGDFTISNGNFTANSLIYPTADGTSGQVLKTDGSGNLSFATVNTNLVADLTPQLGGTLDANGNSIDMGTYTITDAKVGQWDTAYGWGDHSTQNYAVTTGDTMTGDLTFGDGVKAVFGSTSDGIQIYNEASGDKRIVETGSGNLKLQADNIYLQNTAGTANHLIGITGAAVTLNYNNNPKIATTNTGVDVTGTVTADGLTVDGNATIQNTGTPTLTLSDSDGTNQYLRFRHNGNESYIDSRNNTGHGNLYLGRTDGTSNLPAMKISSGGDVSLYADDGTTQGFFWDASTQRLGLGTITPASAIQISGSDAAGGRLEVTRSGVSMYVGSTGGAGYIQTPGAHSLEFYTNGTPRQTISSTGYPRFIGNGDGYAYLEIDTNTADKGQWRFQVDSNPATAKFYLQDYSGGAWNTNLTVDQNGQLGLGIEPDRKLQIKSTVNNPANTTIGLAPSTNDTVQGGLGVGSGGILSVNAVNTVQFRVGGADGDGASEVARIDSSGNVGIGIVPGSAKLFVEGGQTILRNNHTTTSLSGNTDKTAFPHALSVANDSGGSTTNLASIGFSVGTTSSVSNGAIVGHSTAAGTMDLAFYTESSNVIAERMRIDNTGRVTMPYQPFFSAYKNGNQALSAHTPTKITSWSVLYNVGSGWDATNNRWTAPAAGYYLIHVCAQASVLGGLHVRLDVNGSAGWNGDAYLDGGDVTGLNNTYFANLSANDYVDFYCYLTSAGTITANRTRFSVVKLA